MMWFWLNVPLMAVSFAAWSGIPLRMVLRHPHWGPAPADGYRDKAADLEPVVVPANDDHLAGAVPVSAASGRQR
jgi:hypothetical protein